LPIVEPGHRTAAVGTDIASFRRGSQGAIAGTVVHGSRAAESTR
jgi:hypothetical protein